MPRKVCAFFDADGQCTAGVRGQWYRFCPDHRHHEKPFALQFGELTRELPAAMALLLSHLTNRSSEDALAR